MTHRFGRATRLFRARGSSLTRPPSAGSWPPSKPDLSKFRDRPKPPLGISSGYCPPTHFWHKALQTCVPYKHEVCEFPAYWSWERWAKCIFTADPNCVGDSAGIRYMGTDQAIAAGGCVPSQCNTLSPTEWSWSAFDCVPDTKPNPDVARGGIGSRILRRRRRSRRGRVSRRSRIRRSR